MREKSATDSLAADMVAAADTIEVSSSLYRHVEPSPDVPLPPGAEWPDGPDWEPDDAPHQPYRVIYGVPRGINAHGVAVQTTAVQYPNGSLDSDQSHPQVSVDIHYDTGLSSSQARALAAVLVDSADEIDRWAGHPVGVEAPAGADFTGSWDAGLPQSCRVVFGQDRVITDSKLRVYSSVVQLADGTIDDGAIEEPTVNISEDCSDGPKMNIEQARELAGVLLESVREIEGWVQ